MMEPNPAADRLVDHLKNCAKVDAAIVMHRKDESSDEVVQALLDSGWTWDERSTEVISGKRIRYLRRPQESQQGVDTTDESC